MMKKLSIIILFACLATSGWSQSDAIARFFPDIEADENTTRVTISSKMFEMFMHVEPESEEDKELMKTISDLTGMRIVTKSEMSNGMSYYRKSLKKLGAEYEELLSVSQPDENFTFFIREKSGTIEEVFMIFGSENEIVLMSIRGLINLKDLSKLSKKMDVQGMKYLEELDDEKTK